MAFLGPCFHLGVFFTVLGITVFGALTAWLTTQERAALREDVVDALRISGWNTRSVAAQTKTAESRVSMQLNGHAPCSFLGRLCELTGFEVPFLKLRAHRHGMVVIDATELQQLVSAVKALVGKRPAQKMEWEHTA
jgi:hypothetical protein